MATVTHLGATFNTTAGNKTVVATPAVGDLIVVVTACSGLAPGSTNVVDNNSSGTYTQVGTARTGFSTTGLLQVWIRDSFIAAASSTTFTAQQPSSTGGGLSVFKVTGMLRTGANAALQTAGQSTGTAGATPAPAFAAAVNTANPVIGGVGNGTSPATLTPRASFTEGTDLGYSTPTTGLETMFRSSGETGTTMTWGSTSATAFASSVVELDTSALPGPQVVVTEGAWADATSPHDIVVTGCLTGDWLVRISGGDGGLASGNAVTASAFSTIAGSTGAWSDVEKNLPTGGTGWIHIGAAQVTADGDVTVRATRTQTGTARAWGGAILRCRNASGIGVHGFVGQSATQVVALTGVSQDSVVGFILVDWDAGTAATGYTPAGAVDIERANEAGNYTVACAYWSSQASGSRSYGATGLSTSNLVSAAVEVKAATGKTAVGKDLSLTWDTRAALGDALMAIWDVRSAVSDDLVGVWDIRSLVTDSIDLSWDLRAALGDDFNTVWSIREALGDILAIVWDTRAPFGDEVALSWDIRTFFGDIFATSWDIRGAVGDDLVLSWDTRAGLGQTLALSWDIDSLSGAVGKTLSVSWDARAVVGDSLDTSWDIRTMLGDTIALVWDLRLAVGDAVDLSWDVRSAIGDTLAAVWDVRAFVAGALSVLWDIRSPVGDPMVLIWDTRAPAGQSVALVWDVESITLFATKDLAVSWDLRAPVSDDLTVRWDTRNALGDNLVIAWDARAVVATPIDLRWDVRAVVGVSRSLLWDIRVPATDSLTFSWDIRAEVGDNLTLVWDTESDAVTVVYLLSTRVLERWWLGPSEYGNGVVERFHTEVVDRWRTEVRE